MLKKEDCYSSVCCFKRLSIFSGARVRDCEKTGITFGFRNLKFENEMDGNDKELKAFVTVDLRFRLTEK